jgi:hypothetical protein
MGIVLKRGMRMFQIEKTVLDNGSLTEMRNINQSATSNSGVIPRLSRLVGFAIAAFRGHIVPHSEGNYLLSPKGAQRRAANR